jgi:hypothetical protein
MIGGNRVSERDSVDEKDASLLVDAGAHQIWLAANDGGWNDQIPRLQQLYQRFDITPYAQKFDAAGEKKLGKCGDLGLLEQQAPGRHPMQDGLGRQGVQRSAWDRLQPGDFLECIAGRCLPARIGRPVGLGGSAMTAG